MNSALLCKIIIFILRYVSIAIIAFYKACIHVHTYILTHNHANASVHALMWTAGVVNNVSIANRDYMEFKGMRIIDTTRISTLIGRSLLGRSSVRTYATRFYRVSSRYADQSCRYRNKLCCNEAFCYLTRYYFINGASIDSLKIVARHKRTGSAINLCTCVYFVITLSYC